MKKSSQFFGTQAYERLSPWLSSLLAADLGNTCYCYHNDIFDRDRSITEQMVRRAENSGFTALVLTVDTPTFGNRYADTRNKFSLPSHLK